MGDIEAIELRAAWTGNRGILHHGEEIVRTHVGKNWITCDLNYSAPKGQPPRKYTPLYFHDEAASFAAGHRPCWKCRRPHFNAYCDAWSERAGGKAPSATQIDEQLHGERFVPGTSRRAHELP